MKKLALAIALGLSFALPLHAETPAELLVTVNTGNPQTQGMAFALASRAVFGEKVAVRVLLCSEGGKLAIKSVAPVAPLKPLNLTPNDMLRDLMKGGAKVQVCAIFLPYPLNEKLKEDVDPIAYEHLAGMMRTMGVRLSARMEAAG